MRDSLLETDGLYWQSDTHEWYNDKASTDYAQSPSMHGGDALTNIYAFILRNKGTGEYDRVLFDSKKQSIVYNTKVLEELGYKIDKLKIIKRFKR